MNTSTGDFVYVAPSTLEDTVQALTQTPSDGARRQVLAGGTDLIVQLRSVDPGPRTFVDIKSVPETNLIDISDDEVFIGGAVSATTITHHEGLKDLFPGLVESVYLIGSTQIQGRATLVGNLCNASPAGDTIPALIANQASLRYSRTQWLAQPSCRRLCGGRATKRTRTRRVCRRGSHAPTKRYHGRRVSALYSPHRDGYRGSGRGGEPHARRVRPLHPCEGRNWRCGSHGIARARRGRSADWHFR